VAVALRNRWRRRQLQGNLRREVLPMNILMAGPTGSGKTEIARRLANVCHCPFVKVVATKYTEVGVYGADAESMIHDLARKAHEMERNRVLRAARKNARENAENVIISKLRLLDPDPERLRTLLRNGELDQNEVEIELKVTSKPSLGSSFKNPLESLFKGMGMGGKGPGKGMPFGAFQFPPLEDFLNQARGGGGGGGDDGTNPSTRRLRTKVTEAMELLVEQEARESIDEKEIDRNALLDASEKGIVFIDEIDKLCTSAGDRSAISREKGEGVQKELLALLEGTTVDTSIGTIDTSHIFFIAAGAFHNTHVSDLLPELQGRLPIRVSLHALHQQEYERILRETDANLIDQTVALMSVEGVTVRFAPEGIAAIAQCAEEMNTRLENIGARRLRTVMARVMEDLNFTAHKRKGEEVVVDAEFVRNKTKDVMVNLDLMKYVL